LNILDPNRVVDSNYFSYTVVTTLGKVVTGLMTSETSNSVTVKQQEGKSATILRRDIERLQSNGVSLMPAGLEKNINVQQMADLISFIKNWRYLDGRIPIDVD
jgi:putative heme-binding domain-containing protein